MKKSIILASLGFFIVACNSETPTGEVAQLQERRDSIASAIEDLKEELAEIDLQLASLDTTRSFASITTYEVGQGAFNHSFQVYGNVVSDNTIMLYPEMGGTIERVAVREGQSVRAGQTLVSMDATIALASLAEVQTQLDLAKSIFEKQARLWEQEIGSEVQYLQAKTQFEALEKRLAAVRRQVGMTAIVAPFNGVVDQVMAKEGEGAAPGMPMIRMVGGGGLRLEMQVPETYIQRIQKGDEVAMHFSAIQSDMTGVISNVGNYINPGSRTFSVSVDLPSNSDLKSNMMASVQLMDYRADSAITIPNRLILQDTKGVNYTYVYVDKGGIGTIERHDLEIGVANDELTEVLAGISAGEMVVDRGIRSVQPGQTVKIY
jgi:membrane fusion protein (multidrug efflux system)